MLLGYLFVWFVRNAIAQRGRLGPAAHPVDPGGQPRRRGRRHHQYFVPVSTVGPTALSIDYVERTVSLTHGLGYWAVLLAALIVVTGLLFRRRDVS